MSNKIIVLILLILIAIGLYYNFSFEKIKQDTIPQSKYRLCAVIQ